MGANNMKRRNFLVGTTLAIGMRATGSWAEVRNFESELADAQDSLEYIADASGQTEFKELIRENFSIVATSSAPKSKTEVSDLAVKLIVFTEVSSEKYYNRKLRGIIWPGAESGATCAVGYDIGYVTESRLRDDWKQYLDQGVISRLVTACGKRGLAGKQAASLLTDVDIPWSIAYKQFVTDILPSYVYETEKSLANTQLLSKHSLGALVSIVYNRGSSFHLKGKIDEKDPQRRHRYTEMNNIRSHMKNKDFHLIPGEIRDMKRIWDPKVVPGLLKRRDLEADLFEYGLTNG